MTGLQWLGLAGAVAIAAVMIFLLVWVWASHRLPAGGNDDLAQRVRLLEDRVGRLEAALAGATDGQTEALQ